MFDSRVGSADVNGDGVALFGNGGAVSELGACVSPGGQVGAICGTLVGLRVGPKLGALVGLGVGSMVGFRVGFGVGSTVGFRVGLGVFVGLSVGVLVGL
jgi:hypothetical protein